MSSGKGQTECWECSNGVFKDGYCESHWNYLFEGTSNHGRMLAKAKIRELRKEQNKQ